MPAGKDEYTFKQDDTRLEGEISNSETATNEEQTRIGTVVDTRVAAAAAMSGAQAPSGATDDQMRIGTKVDTRGAGGAGGDTPVSSDRMRDAS